MNDTFYGNLQVIFCIFWIFGREPEGLGISTEVKIYFNEEEIEARGRSRGYMMCLVWLFVFFVSEDKDHKDVEEDADDH